MLRERQVLAVQRLVLSFRYRVRRTRAPRTTKAGKPKMGMGWHTRANAEVCLLAKRGKPVIQTRDVQQVIQAPPREHSRKPDEQYARIERLYHGPYLELFARHRRDGWDVWGHEAPGDLPKFPLAREAVSFDDARP